MGTRRASPPDPRDEADRAEAASLAAWWTDRAAQPVPLTRLEAASVERAADLIGDDFDLIGEFCTASIMASREVSESLTEYRRQAARRTGTGWQPPQV